MTLTTTLLRNDADEIRQLVRALPKGRRRMHHMEDRPVIRKQKESTRESHNASTPTKGEAIRQAANKLLEIDQENQRLRADSDRLEWLLRNVSGAEFRRLGIVYHTGCSRADIDGAMCEQDASI